MAKTGFSKITFDMYFNLVAGFVTYPAANQKGAL